MAEAGGQLVTCLLLFTVWLATGQVTDIKVRLVGGLNEREGRVEVQFQGVWGTVCDDGWTTSNDNAGVVCRMMGFTGASRGLGGAYFGEGTDPIWLSDVLCDGNEASLAACRHGGWGNSNCKHDEDVGVQCLGERVSTTTTTTPRPSTTTLPPRICNNPSPDVRLVGGGAEYLGRVQIRRQGVWGEVCDDSWGVQNAKVICRMLCYNPDNARAHLGPLYGNITENYLLDDVICLGDETDIMDCNYTLPLGTNDCGVTEGAGVSCMQDTPTVPPLPEPEVICENDHVTARFSKAGSPGLVASGLTLSNGQSTSCGYTTTEDATSVSINVPFVRCGTRRTDNSTHMTYYSRVQHTVISSNQVITREQVYHIDVYCSLPRNGDPQNEVEPLERTAPPQFGVGTFDTSLVLFGSDRFSQSDVIETFPVPVTLGDWVFVGVSLKTPDPKLKVVVPHCWATANQDPTSQPQHDLIRDRCALESTITVYPINATMFAFRFQSFKFQGNYDFLYIHCKAFVCDKTEKDGDCDRSCSSNSGRKRRAIEDDNTVVSNAKASYRVDKGPIVILDGSEGGQEGYRTRTVAGFSSSLTNPALSSSSSTRRTPFSQLPAHRTSPGGAPTTSTTVTNLMGGGPQGLGGPSTTIPAVIGAGQAVSPSTFQAIAALLSFIIVQQIYCI